MNEPFILIAEDDADDRFLLETAFAENRFHEKIVFVENGELLLDHLTWIKQLKTEKAYPIFILLDLNMPKKSGLEVLKYVKEDSELTHIPVVVFSTTNNEAEMMKCFELGANSYIVKPNMFDSLLKIVSTLHSYWVQPG